MNNCDVSMDILIYRNEFLKLMFTMLKQRRINRKNNRNRQFKTSFPMHVFEFEEVH